MAAQPNMIEMLMRLITEVGPTAYSKDIRHNLGQDLPQGGKPLTSGMTLTAPMTGTTGYTPRPVPTDPLVPLLPTSKQTTPTVAPKPVPTTQKPFAYTDPNQMLLFGDKWVPAWMTSAVQTTGRPTSPPGR